MRPRAEFRAVRVLRMRAISGHPVWLVDCALMDRRLARQNIRTALIAGVISVLMFGLTFLAAYLYTR
jgi:predicted secreted protein